MFDEIDNLDKELNVYCGDCLGYLDSLPNIDCIITDPPYGVHINADWETPDLDTWREIRKVSGNLVCFTAVNQIVKTSNLLTGAGFKIVDCIAWVHQPGMCRAYDALMPAWEPIIVCGKYYYDELPKWPSNSVAFNHDSPKQRDMHLEHLPQVASRCYADSLDNKPDTLKANHHPSVKPLGLMRHLVRIFTNKGDMILDPFAGSCTTGCACVLEDRNYTCIEKEEAYCEIGRARIRGYLQERDSSDYKN